MKRQYLILSSVLLALLVLAAFAFSRRSPGPLTAVMEDTGRWRAVAAESSWPISASFPPDFSVSGPADGALTASSADSYALRIELVPAAALAERRAALVAESSSGLFPPVSRSPVLVNGQACSAALDWNDGAMTRSFALCELADGSAVAFTSARLATATAWGEFFARWLSTVQFR